VTAPELERCADADALAERVATLIAGNLATAISLRGRASVALAGGSSPREAYRRLARRDIEWSAVHVYFGDERCVGPDDPASNYRMAREALLDHVPAQVHRIEGELGPVVAAARYQELLAGSPPLARGSSW
jgi:6-phosphogluconolactonase